MRLFPIIIKYQILNIKNMYEKAFENNARFSESRAGAKGKAVQCPHRSVGPGQNWVRKVNKIYSRVCLLFCFSKNLRSVCNQKVWRFKIWILKNRIHQKIRKIKNILGGLWDVTTFLNGNYYHFILSFLCRIFILLQNEVEKKFWNWFDTQYRF